MKILFIGNYNETSVLTGPEKVAKRIFKESSAVYESVFITYFSDGRKYGLLKKLSGKEAIKDSGEDNIYRLGIIQIIILLFRFKPDIIHIITFERAAILSFIYKLFQKVKVVYNVHGIVAYEDSYHQKSNGYLKLKNRFCENKFFKNSDILVFLSERSLETADKYFIFDKSKIVILPNGIDEIFYQTGRNKKINFNKILKIVFAGDSERKEKGFEFLSETLSRIEIPVEVFIVGDQYTSDQNKKTKFSFINKMGTDDFAGFLSDKDVFISASSYEQFSMATTESMAAGLVPVVTEETGMSSYISDGINGFKLRYGEGEKLLSYLEILNSERIKLEKISIEASKIYLLLNWHTVFEEYKKLYE